MGSRRSTFIDYSLHVGYDVIWMMLSEVMLLCIFFIIIRLICPHADICPSVQENKTNGLSQIVKAYGLKLRSILLRSLKNDEQRKITKNRVEC